jgi:hypothetical protein
MNTDYEIYCWICDNSRNSGEGNLANLFVKKNIKDLYKIYSPNKIVFKYKFYNKVINYKYFSPFIGILFCWYYFLKNKKVAYINYLPLWNLFLFIFLPPRTILGPITGGAKYIKNKKSLFRHYFFPIFYKISEYFLNLRTDKIYFSTELLKKELFSDTVEKSNFNYIFKYYSLKIKRKKNIDFLIYYRLHKNKNAFFPYKLIKKLISLNFKIHIVGDYLNNPSVINHGYLNNQKINDLLAKTSFSIVSNENYYGFFAIECFNNHVKLIIQQSEMNNIKYFKKNFISINYDSIYSLSRLKYYK